MKTLKVTTLAVALLAVPVLAQAAGCNYDKSQQAQSCMAGSSWDAATQSCVPVVNS